MLASERGRALLLFLSAVPASLVTALISKDGFTGKLPSLGFNSWNAYACNISDIKFLNAASLMKSLGLQDAGYEYVNIDDCWQLHNRSVTTNQLQYDPEKFPDGIATTADKLHGLGFKIGIYSDAGTETCGGYPGSIEFEEIDAQTFSGWGIDYLKYDNCNVPTNLTDEYEWWPEYWYGTWENQTQTGGTPAPSGYNWTTSMTAKRFGTMRDALAKQNRTILYSMSVWGHEHVEIWGPETGQNWRLFGDIYPQWLGPHEYAWGVVPIINHASWFAEYSDFYGHNDLDMLEVGNGNLTNEETRTHFALWAAFKSPLLIGTDLSTISDANVELLKNWELLAFNQDEHYGRSALPYKWGVNPDWTWNQTHPAEFYSGQSTRGIHVFIFNSLDKTAKKAAIWAEIPGLSMKSNYLVHDMWTHKQLGVFHRGFSFNIAAHDTAALLITEVDGTHPHPAPLGLPEVYKKKPRKVTEV